MDTNGPFRVIMGEPGQSLFEVARAGNAWAEAHPELEVLSGAPLVRPTGRNSRDTIFILATVRPKQEESNG